MSICCTVKSRNQPDAHFHRCPRMLFVKRVDSLNLVVTDVLKYQNEANICNIHGWLAIHRSIEMLQAIVSIECKMLLVEVAEHWNTALLLCRIGSCCFRFQFRSVRTLHQGTIQITLEAHAFLHFRSPSGWELSCDPDGCPWFQQDSSARFF